ncbi:NAD(P)/FAD-dependent oxidoreductase [Rhodoferax sp. OV413]|uniref:NAD(P)/FAD-dependent oxidoreductase n=1 Tax=Rhodoferax sp. OV413 TaxID=1855285 RepID=UPI0025DF2034|nr:NAD(P)/FAD-dependent oxidoreductase [Rhodoferax sp. OV413]
MADSVIEADAVVIGAGPVGLFQVFQLGLHEVQAHVIDALPYAGGQCIELYADKPIYDIPGVPATTGCGLTNSLLQQIAPMRPQMHFSQAVESVTRLTDGRLQLTTTKGLRFITKTLFVAAGVGAFVPRKPAVPGWEAFEGTQVHYVHDAPLGESASAGAQLVVLGGDESAVLAALALAQSSTHASKPARVTLVHRRDVFGGEPPTLAALEAARASGDIRVIAGQVTGCETQGTRLSGLQLLTADGTSITLPADHVLVRLGVSPKMGPIAGWGWALERKQVPVNTENFQSEIPGIFAVGDINTYPGKRKLILCGFHEATLAAFGAMPLIAPGKEVHLQYTTTSPRLHKLLGGGTDR